MFRGHNVQLNKSSVIVSVSVLIKQRLSDSEVRVGYITQDPTRSTTGGFWRNTLKKKIKIIDIYL